MQRYNPTLPVTSALHEVGGWTPHTRPLYPWEWPGTQFIGGGVNPRMGGENFNPTGIRSPDRPINNVAYLKLCSPNSMCITERRSAYCTNSVEWEGGEWVGSIWKETVMASWRYHPGMCLEGLKEKKTTKTLSHISHKRHNFWKKKKKVTEHKMCVFIFSTNFIWNISHSTGRI